MSEKTHKSIDTNLDLHNLDAVLNAFIAATQDRAAARTEVYENFHRHLIACTGSLAAAVFSKRADSQFTMISQSGWRELNPASLAEVKLAIKQIYAGDHRTKTPKVATYVGRTAPINGVEFLYVLVRPRETDPLVEQLLEDLTVEIVNQIEIYEMRRAESQKPKAVHDLTHLIQLAQNIGRSTNLTQLAMHLVNDLAKATGADRVCYFTARGKLLAVSGVSQVSLKTALARNLSRLARVAGKTRTPIESAEDQVNLENVRRQSVVNQWLQELESDIVYIAPIDQTNSGSSVVSLEYFQTESLEREWTDQRNLIAQSISFIAPVVDRAVQVNTIPGIRLLDFFFNRVLTQPIRLAIWSLGLFALVSVGCYFLFFVHRTFEISAEGILQPTIKRNVFSPSDGEIKSLLVTEGSIVAAGEPLAMIESKDLSDQRIVLDGELAETLQELQNLSVADSQLKSRGDEEAFDRQTQTAAEIERLKSKTETLHKRMALLDQQEADLKLVAPIRGQVTTPDLQHRLDARPVNRGDLLMAIAELDGEWEIELHVPDNRVEFIRAAKSPKFRFRLAADSEMVYEGTFREFDFRVEATPGEPQAMAKALIDFDEANLGANLRVGSRVIAKIDCGQKSNWFLLTYELKQKIDDLFFW